MKTSNSRERINTALLPGWHYITTKTMKAIKIPPSPPPCSKSLPKPRGAT